MEIDHELSNKELAIRILGLTHVVRLMEDMGGYDYDSGEELKHAAFVLAERLALEGDV